MRIWEFISKLSDEPSIEYRGNENAIIRGFSQKATRRHVRRRFYLLPEHNWHPGKPEIFRSLQTSSEQEIQRALDNGAVGVVCPLTLRDSPILMGKNCIFVDDTKRFFHLAARILRHSMTHQKLILITGSVGKSTTRRMIANALQSAHPDKRVGPKRGNANLSTFVLREISAAPMFDYSVVEAAASAFRGFDKEGFTPSPDVAVLTSIAEAHLKTYGTTENVARRKSDIFAAPPPGGAAVINADAPHADILLERASREGCRIFTYGESQEAHVRLTSYRYDTGVVTAEFDQQVLSYSLSVPGKHMALNSLAVIATLLALDEPQWEDAVRSLDGFAPGWGRGRVREVGLWGGGTVHLIDESHNANPASMRAALEAFAQRPLPPGARRVAILGDMLELGSSSGILHMNVAESEAVRRLDEVHLFGVHMESASASFTRTVPVVRHWSSLEDLTSSFSKILRAGDYVLAKASLDTGLSTVVNKLVKDGQVD